LGELALDVEDTAEIGIHYQSGVLGSVHLDYNQRPSAHTLEVIGTQGTLHWENTSGMVRVEQLPTEATDVLVTQYPAPPGFERNDLFLAEMSHFLAVARGEAQPVCTLEDGIQALRLALAAKRSAEQGELVNLTR